MPAQAGALNDHLQPETADAVQRLKADEEAEGRTFGVCEDDGAWASPDSQPENLEDSGPQDEPGSVTVRPKVPEILKFSTSLRDAGPSSPPQTSKSTIQLFLYHFQVECLTSPLLVCACVPLLIRTDHAQTGQHPAPCCTVQCACNVFCWSCSDALRWMMCANHWTGPSCKALTAPCPESKSNCHHDPACRLSSRRSCQV